MTVARIYPNTTDFSQHERQGRFLIDLHSDTIAGLVIDADKTLELQHSEQMWNFYMLDSTRALGVSKQWRCYLAEFVEAGWSSPIYEYPMALWDIESGVRILSLQGLHWGDVVGASMITDQQFITWGRDYLIRLWDGESGECLDILPIPLWSDNEGIAVLSSERFGNLNQAEQLRYIQDKHLPFPRVRLDWIVAPDNEAGTQQHSFICPISTDLNPQLDNTCEIRPWVPSSDSSQHFSHHIHDVNNAEAGYSTAIILDDGRIVAGGTTYGASGFIYLWDGLFDLCILMPGRYGVNFELLGETHPGVIETYEPTGTNTGNRYLFKLSI